MSSIIGAFIPAGSRKFDRRYRFMMLVTGASGFVGSAVLRRLIEAGEQVRALVRPTSERRNLDGIDVEIVEGDLSLPKTLRAGLDGCKGLYHVAADYRLWTREPRKMLDTNVDGTRAIMLAAAEVGVDQGGEQRRTSVLRSLRHVSRS